MLGESEVMNSFPENHKQLVRYIRKQMSHKNKKNKNKDNNVEGDEETETKEIEMKASTQEESKIDFTQDFKKPETSEKQESSSSQNIIQPKKKHSRSGVIIKESGDIFRNKSAGGDLKKDNLDPYAYIQFHPGLLNRRKKDKANLVLSQVLKKSKQGVFKGLKTRKLK